MKFILSISGGGIRGIIPAVVLAELENITQKPIAKSFDLIAGTSTGGIIASMLAVPGKNQQPKYSAQKVVELYKDFGKTVFNQSFLRKLFSLNGLIGTKYSYKTLEKLLIEYLGNAYLSNTITNLLIPAYKIEKGVGPYFFKTLHAKQTKSKIENPLLWKCARATSAANGYFEPYKLDEQHIFLDGGLFANNPAMCAYAQAKNLYGEQEKITLVSIETGENLVGYQYDKIRNWGFIQWAEPFFKQISSSASGAIDYMLRALTTRGDRYFRIQTDLDKKSLKMDDASDSNIQRLEMAAKRSIRKHYSELSEIANLIKA